MDVVGRLRSARKTVKQLEERQSNKDLLQCPMEYRRALAQVNQELLVARDAVAEIEAEIRSLNLVELQNTKDLDYMSDFQGFDGIYLLPNLKNKGYYGHQTMKWVKERGIKPAQGENRKEVKRACKGRQTH